MQIAEYVRGRQRIVEHVGSAHTEAELGMLMERARELLDNPAQGVLDLGVEPTPPVKGLVTPVGDPGLFTVPDTATSAGRDGPGRVVGTDSRILFDVLAGVFTALGFDGLDDEVFRDLVIARVVEPTSLLDAGRVLRDLGRSAASYATMKRDRGAPDHRIYRAGRLPHRPEQDRARGRQRHQTTPAPSLGDHRHQWHHTTIRARHQRRAANHPRRHPEPEISRTKEMSQVRCWVSLKLNV